jgi:exodeoxyribonuclease V alpha subunit
VVSFFPDQRIVEYKRDDIPELDPSCAITIHKSQGSEFGAVMIPVLTQHFKMLLFARFTILKSILEFIFLCF